MGTLVSQTGAKDAYTHFDVACARDQRASQCRRNVSHRNGRLKKRILSWRGRDTIRYRSAQSCKSGGGRRDGNLVFRSH